MAILSETQSCIDAICARTKSQRTKHATPPRLNLTLPVACIAGKSTFHRFRAGQSARCASSATKRFMALGTMHSRGARVCAATLATKTERMSDALTWRNWDNAQSSQSKGPAVLVASKPHMSKQCVLCAAAVTGDGHDASPVASEGTCCDACFHDRVLPEMCAVPTQHCVLCNRAFTGFGNNAQPLTSGLCCDMCNVTRVIRARLQRK